MGLGLAAGAVGVALVARVLRGLLHGVQPFDPLTLGISVATLCVCAALALVVPLRRAARTDAVQVLR
jgi:ABC-type antimicrobial peptide transport system permease subunit